MSIKNNISIIITERDEQYLEQTIKSVLDSFPKEYARPQILVVQDGGPEKRTLTKGLLDGRTDKHIHEWQDMRGCQYARDVGIMKASREIVVVVDAHMDFESNCFLKIAKMIEENPRRIVGCGCGGLDPVTWSRDDTMRYGAVPIKWSEPDPGVAKTPIMHKWCRSRSPNNAMAHGLMGAVYAMKKSFYAEDLMRPWKFGKGWGCDEECLSIAAYLAGGEVVTADTRAWHWFRSAADLPYKLTAIGTYGQYINKIRLFVMFPGSEEIYKKAMDMMFQDRAIRQLRPVLKKFLEEEHDEVLQWRKDFGSMYELELDDYFDNICITMEQYLSDFYKDGGNLIKEKKDCIIIGDSNNLPDFPTVEESAEIFCETVVECKHIEKVPTKRGLSKESVETCVKCGTPYGKNDMINEYPNGNRRYRCGSCNHNCILRLNRRK